MKAETLTVRDACKMIMSIDGVDKRMDLRMYLLGVLSSAEMTETQRRAFLTEFESEKPASSEEKKLSEESRSLQLYQTCRWSDKRLIQGDFFCRRPTARFRAREACADCESYRMEQ